MKQNNGQWHVMPACVSNLIFHLLNTFHISFANLAPTSQWKVIHSTQQLLPGAFIWCSVPLFDQELETKKYVSIVCAAKTCWANTYPKKLRELEILDRITEQRRARGHTSGQSRPSGPGWLSFPQLMRQRKLNHWTSAQPSSYRARRHWMDAACYASNTHHYICSVCFALHA